MYALWKQVAGRRGKGIDQLTPLEQLRDLLIRLSETWASFCTFYHDPAISWTNNGADQVIGHLKMRARTLRGVQNLVGYANRPDARRNEFNLSLRLSWKIALSYLFPGLTYRF